jgi:hypothetical protein
MVEGKLGSRGRVKVNSFHSKLFLRNIYKFIVCKFCEHTVEKEGMLFIIL